MKAFVISATASTLIGAVAAGALDVTPPQSVWADVKVEDTTTAASAELIVQNQAGSPVTLANCLSSHAVPAGGSVKLPLDGVVGYWVVPEGLAWDCDSGPFDLFYVAANLSGPDMMTGVGFGAAVDGVGPTEASSVEAQKEDESKDEDRAEEKNETDVDEARDATADVAGVELAFATEGDGVRGVRCRRDLCSSSTTTSSLPSSLELNIMGPKSNVLSFWYGGGWGHHYHHHHYHHHGGGWGHHHHHHHYHHWYVSSHLMGADKNDSTRVDEETLQAAWGSTCAVARRSWFCSGSTKVVCCRRTWGWAQCGSVRSWHSCR